jgi:asparagine synthetase B (glutamine-hydrolysing)
MAGIAGIIKKNSELSEKDLSRSIASMMQKIFFDHSQLSGIFSNDHICFGIVAPVSAKENNRFQHNKALRVYALIDGRVFVDVHQRDILKKIYDTSSQLDDCFYVPYLYKYYKNDFIRHITGCHNIFIYDENENESLLINDRLGFLPQYCYDSEAYFIFASKIEAILSSGLLPSISADPVTIAEHLFFNYPLSDHTYIKDIHTLSNAESITITRYNTAKKKYWSISELFDFKPAGKKESLELMDQGLKQAIDKIISRHDKVNLSLTGGWDSRVVLSYLLPEYREILNAYSFGAEGAPDIIIPRQIAQAEKFSFTPYILDQDYLDNSFIANAVKTIELSGGTRNYLRTHYLYAVQNVADTSDILVTGIFGDEVFKVAQAMGGEVISQNLIDLLQADFGWEQKIKELAASELLACLNVNKDRLLEGLSARLQTLRDRMRAFENISQKYYSFRFEYNLRKYFGNEANSYNDFVFCFSPFIDYDFLTSFAQTGYFGIHYEFNSNSMVLKRQSTRLYHDLVLKNHPSLVEYNTSRGYSMKEAGSLMGNFRIILRNYLQKKETNDDFNTRPTNSLFSMFLKRQELNPSMFSHLEDILKEQVNPNTLSLFYWLGRIEQKYSK